MEKTALGQSGIDITKITFGSWAIGGWMWGGADKKDALNALKTAIDIGMTTIDTAPIYGFGQSEEIVGEAIQNHRDKVQILTKYGLRWDIEQGIFYFETKDNNGKLQKVYKYSGKESVIEECERSLKRLNLDVIDLYQIHWPDDTTPPEETMEAIEKLKDQGKIKAGGVSNYDVESMQKALKKTQLASNQVPYSMLKRDIEKDVVPFCLEHNIGILAYSPLQRGILTGKFQPGHQFNEGDTRAGSPFYTDEGIRKINSFLQNIQPLAISKGLTIPQLVLNWTSCQPGITSVLAGARNPEQVKDNANALKVKLSKEELGIIDAELSQLNFE